MRSLLISAIVAVAGVVLAVGVAACGSSKTKTSGITATAVTTGTLPPTTEETAPPEAPSTKDDKDEITKLTKRYLAALGAEDFKKLCGLLAPESISRFHAAAEKEGLDAPSCAATYRRVYRDRLASSDISRLARTAHITQISQSGDSAAIVIEAEYKGKATTINKSATLIDGRWKLIDFG
jgi:predicted lipid-binding transport protein (Tim44 family)